MAQTHLPDFHCWHIACGQVAAGSISSSTRNTQNAALADDTFSCLTETKQ